MPPPPRFNPCALVLAAACFAAGGGWAVAQPEPTLLPRVNEPQPVPAELEPFEGRLVRVITFRTPDRAAAAGTAPLPGGPLDATTESLARNQLRLREGAPFSSALVSDDITRLNRLGRFKRVESRVQGLADGSVEVLYIVDPQPLVTAVQTVGNRAFADSDLIGNGEAIVGTPIDQTQLARGARSIEERYRAKGYYNALVTLDEKELEQTGIVLFRIREGEKTRVSVVNFEGNVSFSDQELLTAVKTQESWLLFKKTPVNEDQLAQDVSAIIAYYRDRGYLDVRADRVVTPSPNGREAIVTFVIDEGPVYTLRNVQSRLVVEGEVPVFTNEQLLGLMSIRPGDIYSEGKLKKSIDAVRDAYGISGYNDVRLERHENRDGERPLVDVVILIVQGRRWKTGLVEIQGNDLTRDDVVRRSLQIFPDRPLDSTAITLSENRLKQSGLFNRNDVKITVQPEQADNPGYRDVLVQVQETNTGRISFGGSIGSDGGLIGLLSLEQNNFDITDTPDTFGEFIRGDAFRGGGQTFNVSALPGTESAELAVSLSDPYVFGTNYSGSIGAYYRTRQFRSYDEQRVGLRLSAGKRFGSRWTVSVPVKFEQVELSDIDTDAPVDYFDVQDARLLSSIGINLARTSLDNPRFPTKGNRIQFGVDQVFGDFNFNKLSFDYDTYLRLSEDVLGRSTTLRLSTAVRYQPQDTDSIPFYERNFLGGQNFRGFAFRRASPVGIRNDNGEIGNDPIGGRFSFFMGAEVRKPVYEDVISVVFFVDTGTVDTEVSFSNYRVSIGTGLRIFVPFSPVPLAFDFGFPIIREETDKKRVFTFSVDVPFR